MHLVASLGLLLSVVSASAFAETIPDLRVNGQPVDHCAAINGVIDCRRGLMTASAVCKGYGFRRAIACHLQQHSTKAMQLRLSINEQETVTRSEWKPTGRATPYDSIECSR